MARNCPPLDKSAANLWKEFGILRWIKSRMQRSVCRDGFGTRRIKAMQSLHFLHLFCLCPSWLHDMLQRRSRQYGNHSGNAALQVGHWIFWTNASIWVCTSLRICSSVALGFFLTYSAMASRASFCVKGQNFFIIFFSVFQSDAFFALTPFGCDGIQYTSCTSCWIDSLYSISNHNTWVAIALCC